MRFLWQDSYTSKASASKIWMHICYGVSTYIILKLEEVRWELLLVYMAVVGGSEIAKKLLTLKFGGQQSPSTNQEKHT